MPGLQELLPAFTNNLLNPSQLVCLESPGLRQGDGIKPELRDAPRSLYVDVWGFLDIVRIEKETIRTDSINSRRHTSLYCAVR
jgi:hypothetical protein